LAISKDSITKIEEAIKVIKGDVDFEEFETDDEVDIY
jgi:hypothetical protein